MARACPFCKVFLDDNLSVCPCGYDFKKPVEYASACPNCGKVRSKKVQPDTLIAFVSDRICLSCKTRYRLPTPLWAAIVFVVIGILMAGLALMELVIRLLSTDFMGDLQKANPNAFLIGVDIVFLVVGGRMFYHGIRCLANPGKR